jgi:hypothetical protein
MQLLQHSHAQNTKLTHKLHMHALALPILKCKNYLRNALRQHTHLFNARNLHMHCSLPRTSLSHPRPIGPQFNLIPKPQFQSVTNYALPQATSSHEQTNNCIRAQVHDMTQINPCNTSHEHVTYILKSNYTTTSVSNYHATRSISIYHKLQ